MANKQIFYLMTFTIQLSRIESQTITNSEILEIDPVHARKTSKIFEFAMETCKERWDKINHTKWNKENVTIDYFNFWDEEREIIVKFEDLPIEEWEISEGLLNALKDIPVKNFKELSKYSEGDLKLIRFGKRNLFELKLFLKKNGVKLIQI